MLIKTDVEALVNNGPTYDSKSQLKVQHIKIAQKLKIIIYSYLKSVLNNLY